MKSIFGAGIACLLVGSGFAQQVPSQRRSHLVASAAKDQSTQQPIAPAAPLAPEQVPASPPQVAFNSGILTVIANNSTLGDILRAVHRQTGAVVDVPGNATERVVGRFGPGPVRDVLALLLNGSHFNYVLLGSATNPNALERVMLISKAVGAVDEPAQQASASGPQHPTPVTAPQAAENTDAANDDSGDMPQESPDAPDDQANQAQPEEQPQQQPNPFGQPGAVKTPEQLLQELQQRQQQMQQQQQGSPQSFPPSPMGTPQPPQPPQQQ